MEIKTWKRCSACNGTTPVVAAGKAPTHCCRCGATLPLPPPLSGLPRYRGIYRVTLEPHVAEFDSDVDALDAVLRDGRTDGTNEVLFHVELVRDLAPVRTHPFACAHCMYVSETDQFHCAGCGGTDWERREPVQKEE